MRIGTQSKLSTGVAMCLQGRSPWHQSNRMPWWGLARSLRRPLGGAIEFLTKPFRDQDLLDAIQLAIAQDRARRDAERADAMRRDSLLRAPVHGYSLRHLPVAGEPERPTP